MQRLIQAHRARDSRYELQSWHTPILIISREQEAISFCRPPLTFRRFRQRERIEDRAISRAALHLWNVSILRAAFADERLLAITPAARTRYPL